MHPEFKILKSSKYDKQTSVLATKINFFRHATLQKIKILLEPF